MNDKAINAKTIFNKVAIVGVGIIGGSLGMALIDRGLADKVVGVDLDQENLHQAQEFHAVHEVADITNAIRDADLVVIAVPIGQTANVFRKIAPLLKEGAIVTDVSSTKKEMIRSATEILPKTVHFVGGHPMTGSEICGVKGADPYLFENAVYVLTPTNETDDKALQTMKQMCQRVGSRTIELTPDEHDMMVATVSHLPHLMAVNLVNTVGNMNEKHPGTFLLAAGGFRDTTRVASSLPGIWKDICQSNADNIIQVIDLFIKNFREIRSNIQNAQQEELVTKLKNARALRSNIPAKLKGSLGSVYELVVTVEDKPGALAQLTAILGTNGININEIEILRVREGEGGTIRIGVDSAEHQAIAVKLLNQNSISARKR